MKDGMRGTPVLPLPSKEIERVCKESKGACCTTFGGNADGFKAVGLVSLAIPIIPITPFGLRSSTGGTELRSSSEGKTSKMVSKPKGVRRW